MENKYLVINQNKLEKSIYGQKINILQLILLNILLFAFFPLQITKNQLLHAKIPF